MNNRSFRPNYTFYCAVVLVIFWSAYGLNVLARSSWQQNYGRAQLTRPLILNGLLFRPGPGSADLPTTGRQLVLVTSDTCSFSQAGVPEWLQLVEEINFRSPDSVSVISLRGRTLPDHLSARLSELGVPHQVHVLTDVSKAVFMQQTGIAWTPEIMLVDEQRRIRLSSPRLTPSLRDALVRSFVHGQRSADRPLLPVAPTL
jgi:hypothetical protein